MKFSFSTLGCPDWDLEKIAAKAVEYGFEGVELRVKGKQHVDPEMTGDERKYVRELFKSKGVAICCLAGYTKFSSDRQAELKQNMDLMNSYIQLAADLEAPYIRTFVGHYPSTLTEDQVAENAARCLEICGKNAAERGITILIETHDAFNTGARVGKVLNRMNNHGIAALWDIHHSFRGGEDPEETCRILGKYVQHMHIKDSSIMKEGKDQLCLMGYGEMPVMECLRQLRDIGFTGYLSLEWEKMWCNELEEPEVAFPQYIAYMKELLRKE